MPPLAGSGSTSLVAMEVLPAEERAAYTALGELSLDGSVTSVAGVLLAGLADAGRASGKLTVLTLALQPSDNPRRTILAGARPGCVALALPAAPIYT